MQWRNKSRNLEADKGVIPIAASFSLYFDFQLRYTFLSMFSLGVDRVFRPMFRRRPRMLIDFVPVAADHAGERVSMGESASGRALAFAVGLGASIRHRRILSLSHLGINQ